jgi:hypothetical protein
MITDRPLAVIVAGTIRGVAAKRQKKRSVQNHLEKLKGAQVVMLYLPFSLYSRILGNGSPSR